MGAIPLASLFPARLRKYFLNLPLFPPRRIRAILKVQLFGSQRKYFP
jgi:hypothetical protein